MPRPVPRPPRMTVEFCRNVLGLADANSSEMDPTTQHPVIDLMHDQLDVTDKGGTMRLGAYYAVLEPGTKVAEAYGEPVVSERHRHRYEFNSQLPSPPRRARLRVLGGVAGPPPRRVHRARRSPVLGRHAGPSGVQEPPGPPASAVPRADRRGPGASPSAARLARRSRRRRTQALERLPSRRRARDLVRATSTGSSTATFESPSGERFERDVVRSPGAVSAVPIVYADADPDGTPSSSSCRSTGRRTTRWSSRSPPGCATSTARPTRTTPGASWSRRSASAPATSSC